MNPMKETLKAIISKLESCETIKELANVVTKFAYLSQTITPVVLGESKEVNTYRAVEAPLLLMYGQFIKACGEVVTDKNDFEMIKHRLLNGVKKDFQDVFTVIEKGKA